MFAGIYCKFFVGFLSTTFLPNYRVNLLICDVLIDYEYSLWGLPEGSIERENAKREVHTRSAHRLQELCFKNGGIYIKLGQHISQLVCCSCVISLVAVYQVYGLTAVLYGIALFQEYLIPDEYVHVMRESLLNKCPVSSYDQVLQVFRKELGGKPDEVCTLN